jgi:hypothetical protein
VRKALRLLKQNGAINFDGREFKYKDPIQFASTPRVHG